jgi:hypothetical protein
MNPSINFRFNPCNRAASEVHWQWKLGSIHLAVNRRAAIANPLDDLWQPQQSLGHEKAPPRLARVCWIHNV